MIIMPITQKLYSNQTNPYAIIEKKFKVMNQILYYVNQLYYEDVDMEALMDGAFKGIMDELDPHSIFISAKDQENIDELFRGEFQGIGIEFDILNNYIRPGVMVRVFPDNVNTPTQSAQKFLDFPQVHLGLPTNMTGLLSYVSDGYSGETYNVEISFITEQGLIIINDTFVAP